MTMGMAMTEKQGGSDVRANTTRAVPADQSEWGQGWHLTGHKWFCSAPMSDAFLTLPKPARGSLAFSYPDFDRTAHATTFHPTPQGQTW